MDAHARGKRSSEGDTNSRKKHNASLSTKIPTRSVSLLYQFRKQISERSRPTPVNLDRIISPFDLERRKDTIRIMLVIYLSAFILHLAAGGRQLREIYLDENNWTTFGTTHWEWRLWKLGNWEWSLRNKLLHKTLFAFAFATPYHDMHETVLLEKDGGKKCYNKLTVKSRAVGHCQNKKRQ